MREGGKRENGSGKLEKNALLYVSGYIKPIYDENSSPEGDLTNCTSIKT